MFLKSIFFSFQKWHRYSVSKATDELIQDGNQSTIQMVIWKDPTYSTTYTLFHMFVCLEGGGFSAF